MYVKEKQQNSEARYYLAEREWTNGAQGDESIICAYGKQKPTFTYPDCRHGLAENHLPDIADGSVDLIIDDPPYGTTQATWDNEPEWADIADRYHRVLADDGTLVVFGKQPSLIPVYNVFTEHNFDFRFELIWKKHTNPWVSSQAPIPIHENIFVFAKSGTKAGDLTFNTDQIRREGAFWCPNCRETKSKGSYTVCRNNDDKSQTQGGWQEEYESEGGTDRYPISYIDDHVLDATALPSYETIDEYVDTNDPTEAAQRLRQMADMIEETGTTNDVLEAKSVGGSHPEYMGYAAQKPTDLLSWIILAMTNRGDTVLDPHMGSGSTLAASIPLARESIGIEVNPERFNDTVDRVDGIMTELKGLKHADVELQDGESNPKAAKASDD
jgi:DNA modification methylase